MLSEGVESVKAEKLLGRDMCVGGEPAIVLLAVRKKRQPTVFIAVSCCACHNQRGCQFSTSCTYLDASCSTTTTKIYAFAGTIKKKLSTMQNSSDIRITPCWFRFTITSDWQHFIKQNPEGEFPSLVYYCAAADIFICS